MPLLRDAEVVLNMIYMLSASLNRLWSFLWQILWSGQQHNRGSLEVSRGRRMWHWYLRGDYFRDTKTLPLNIMFIIFPKLIILQLYLQALLIRMKNPQVHYSALFSRILLCFCGVLCLLLKCHRKYVVIKRDEVLTVKTKRKKEKPETHLSKDN